MCCGGDPWESCEEGSVGLQRQRAPCTSHQHSPGELPPTTTEAAAHSNAAASNNNNNNNNNNNKCNNNIIIIINE